MGRQHVRHGFIAVRQQKTGGSMQIPVHPDLQEILAAHPVETLMAIAATRLVSGLGEQTRGAAPPIAHWFRYARIMYFNGLLSSAIGHLDRFIIGAAIGTHGVATLMVVRQLHQLPTVFHQMFLTVVAPMFVAAAGDPVGGPRRQALYDMTTDWVMRLA